MILCFLELGGIGPSFEYVTITRSLEISPKLKIFVLYKCVNIFAYVCICGYVYACGVEAGS